MQYGLGLLWRGRAARQPSPPATQLACCAGASGEAKRLEEISRRSPCHRVGVDAMKKVAKQQYVVAADHRRTANSARLTQAPSASDSASISQKDNTMPPHMGAGRTHNYVTGGHSTLLRGSVVGFTAPSAQCQSQNSCVSCVDQFALMRRASSSIQPYGVALQRGLVSSDCRNKRTYSRVLQTKFDQAATMIEPIHAHACAQAVVGAATHDAIPVAKLAANIADHTRDHARKKRDDQAVKKLLSGVWGGTAGSVKQGRVGH
eukprot:COSAG02_NODE_12674_length_1511_cov_1.269830_2_plen_260_part_01